MKCDGQAKKIECGDCRAITAECRQNKEAVQLIMTPMYERRLQKQGHGDAKRGWVGGC